MSLYKQIFATANFILAICGYQFVTTLLLPISNDVEVATQTVTIPFRIVSLFVTIATIILHLRNTQQIPTSLKLFLMYWGIMCCRILYDLNINPDIAVTESYKTFVYTWTAVCLTYMISAILSYNSINFSVAFKACYILLLVTLLMTMSGNEMMFDEDVEGRLDGNAALNTISFGHTGVSLAILAMWALSRSKRLCGMILHIIVFAIGLFIMLRAGSRGPLIAILGVMLFYMLSKIQSKLLAVLILMIGLVCIYLNYDILLDLIGHVSPVMKYRLGNSIHIGDSSGRDLLMNKALQGIAESPLFGKSFSIPQGDGTMLYPHNSFIEAFMSCGIIAGGGFVLLNIYTLARSFGMIQNKMVVGWVALLFVQRFLYGMFSSAIYINYEFSFLMVMVLQLSNYYMRNRMQIQMVK